MLSWNQILATEMPFDKAVPKIRNNFGREVVPEN